MQSGHIHHIAGYTGRRETCRAWNPLKGDFKIGGNPIKRIGGALGTAAQDVGGFAWKGVKDVASFQLNLVTLGAANKFTSVSKWSGTGFAGKAGTVAGWTAAAVAGGYAASGLFAPAATGVGASAIETAPLAVGGEIGGGMFAEEAAAGSGVFWAEPAAAAISGAEAGGAAIATGAGTTASWLPSGSSLLGAGILAQLLKPVGEALGGKAGEYINEVFGGSAGAPGSSGSGGGFAGGDMGGGSKLPFIIIGVVLLGAYLLTRKGRK